MSKTSKPTAVSPKRSAARRPSAAARIIAALASIADKHRLRWYLFGAQAVTLYGVSRTTADVDVTVEIPPAQVPVFVREMSAAGFALRVPDAVQFAAMTRVLPFEHLPTGWPTDVILAGPGMEESFLAGARRIDLGGVQVPVIAPEHLIALKVLAGRPKDREDVRGLLRQGPGVASLAAARAVLGELEAALGRSDLLPLLERLALEAAPAARDRRPGRRRPGKP